MPFIILDEIVFDRTLGMEQNNTVLLISQDPVARDLKRHFFSTSALNHKYSLLLRPLYQVEFNPGVFALCASKSDIGS